MCVVCVVCHHFSTISGPWEPDKLFQQFDHLAQTKMRTLRWMGRNTERITCKMQAKRFEWDARDQVGLRHREVRVEAIYKYAIASAKHKGVK